jgi:nucleoside-diphosphate-sugar epimerase
MADEHFLITGGMGCIGAWVIRNLVAEGVRVSAFDLSSDRHRLELVMGRESMDQVSFIQGDIRDKAAVADAFTGTGATHVIHLAALQVPFCRADPSLGAAVNVQGTANVFEAAKTNGMSQVIYASSVAVYGPREMYPQRLLPHEAPPHPLSHYGVYKQANEGTARIYWQDDGIASVGLRPYTVYGPARDQGMTSTPTLAMLAAARGETHHISYGGNNGFQYADDVARIFIRAARKPHQGADAYNIQGSVAHMSELVAAIEIAEPAARGRITYEPTPLPFPDGQEETALRQFLGEIPHTSLEEGVALTIAHFRWAFAAGLLPKA